MVVVVSSDGMPLYRYLPIVQTRASDKCQREKRKTINGDDLLWAMSTLGFEDYVEPLKLYLHKYREVGDLVLAVVVCNGGVMRATQCCHITQSEKIALAKNHATGSSNDVRAPLGIVVRIT